MYVQNLNLVLYNKITDTNFYLAFVFTTYLETNINGISLSHVKHNNRKYEKYFA